LDVRGSARGELEKVVVHPPTLPSLCRVRRIRLRAYSDYGWPDPFRWEEDGAWMRTVTASRITGEACRS
jgi:hypothetical protein